MSLLLKPLASFPTADIEAAINRICPGLSNLQTFPDHVDGTNAKGQTVLIPHVRIVREIDPAAVVEPSNPTDLAARIGRLEALLEKATAPAPAVEPAKGK